MKSLHLFSALLLSGSILVGSPALAGERDQPRRGLAIGGECEDCDFSDKNLSGATFIGAEFAGSSFRNSELVGSSFMESRFAHTDFSHADMDETQLRGVTFLHSDLSHVDLNNARVERVNFSDTDLTRTNFSEGELVFVTFIGSELTNTRFIDSELQQVNFLRATLNGTVFRDAQLRDANFSHVVGEQIDFRDADLTDASFKGAVLHQVDFREAELSGVDFSSAVIVDPRGLTKSALAGACGNEETQIGRGVSLPPCNSEARRNVGYTYNFRVLSREGRDETEALLQELEAVGGIRVELLNQLGSLHEDQAQQMERQQVQHVVRAAMRDLAQREREIERAIREAERNGGDVSRELREEQRELARAQRETVRAFDEIERDLADVQRDRAQIRRGALEQQRAFALEMSNRIMRQEAIMIEDGQDGNFVFVIPGPFPPDDAHGITPELNEAFELEGGPEQRFEFELASPENPEAPEVELDEN